MKKRLYLYIGLFIIALSIIIANYFLSAHFNYLASRYFIGWPYFIYSRCSICVFSLVAMGKFAVFSQLEHKRLLLWSAFFAAVSTIAVILTFRYIIFYDNYLLICILWAECLAELMFFKYLHKPRPEQ